LAGFSAGAFYRHRLRTLDMGPAEIGSTILAAARGIRTSDRNAKTRPTAGLRLAQAMAK